MQGFSPFLPDPELKDIWGTGTGPFLLSVLSQARPHPIKALAMKLHQPHSPIHTPTNPFIHSVIHS